MNIQRVIQSAARRRLGVVALEELAFAVAPVLLGFIVLLLLGTQILHWYWLAALAAIGVALVTVRVRSRNLSTYETAQVLDHRMGLNDSLSTAWFLLESGDATANSVARFQIEQTESLAAALEPARAFPFVWRRAWTLTAALAAVALGLFAVRYLVTKSLSLQPSILPAQITPVFEALETRLLGKDHMPGDSSTKDQSQAASGERGAQLPDQKQAMNPEEKNGAGQSGTQEGIAEGKSQAQSGKPADSQNGDSQSKAGDGANSQANAPQPEQSAASEKTAQNEEGKRQGSTGQQGAQGVMEKMKDALSSLMAKMQNSAQQQRQNSQSSDENKTGTQSSGKAQQGQQQDAQNRGSNQDQSADSQTQAQASERTQGSQGRSSDAMPEKGADAHSGIGRQDGDKSLKEAEQLAAMGKLAEIIGKRSAALTGEMTVETPSSKQQQLKTAYSQKVGQHSDSGGEINRDEIPLADQQYVREYMELVRKQGKTEK